MPWLRRWLLLASLSAIACESPVGSTAEPIIAGELAPDAAAVVAVVERSAACLPEPRQLRCTGTLIAPRAVLTAAHCLGDGLATDLAVLFDASLTGTGAVVPVVAGAVHPGFDPESRASDLAVLVLESDAPVAPLARGVVDEAALGTQVTMLGYGGVSADDPEGGDRRSGTGLVDRVEATELRLVPDPAMSCRGDSGGPVLDADGALIAVTSRGDPACAEFATVARVDAAEPFIATALTGDPPPAQRPFDPDEHFCTTTCSGDADCPSGTHCVTLGGASARCVLPALSPGELLGPCSDDRVCGEAPCVATPAGCQCFEPCGAHSHADMGIEPSSGGGCQTSPGGGTGAPLVLWVLLVWIRQFHRRLSRN